MQFTKKRAPIRKVGAYFQTEQIPYGTRRTASFCMEFAAYQQRKALCNAFIPLRKTGCWRVQRYCDHLIRIQRVDKLQVS
jgi:hypothetical protein